MKHLTFIKTTTKPIIAHLYEHLYCRALTELFRKDGLMNYIDYHVEGKTFHGGYVYLAVWLYTKQAESLVDQIAQLKLSLDEASLGICTYQVMAERQQRLSGNPGKVVTSLKKLDEQPWVSLEDFGVYDTWTIRRSSLELWHGRPQVHLFRILQGDLFLDPSVAESRRELAPPLLYVLSEVISRNISDELVERYGYYNSSSSSKYTRHLAKETFSLRILQRVAPSLTEALEACRLELTSMLKLGLIQKLAAYLKSATYQTSWQAPDELKLYKATEILIGSAGWREIATQTNIKELLRHTTLELKYGRERQSLKLSELL